MGTIRLNYFRKIFWRNYKASWLLREDGQHQGLELKGRKAQGPTSVDQAHTNPTLATET